MRSTRRNKRFRDAYQAKFNDYRLGSVVGYSTVIAAVAIKKPDRPI
jgi:hypothetical protein